MAERRACGTYNATGPEHPLRLGEVAQTCIDVTGGPGPAVVVPSDDARAAGIEGWKHIPFWLDPGETGIMQANIDRALVAGLRFRPLAETVRDTYAWLQSSPHRRLIDLPAELERAAIEKWQARWP
jgi:2'-hydroxyisoflavone reductase